MNKTQVEIIKKFDGNYSIETIPGLVEQPKMTFYRWDKGMQTVIEMPNLPSDPVSLKRYLSKGFSTSREKFERKEESNG